MGSYLLQKSELSILGLIVLLLAGICSCDKKSDLRVGMTYEEVQQILGHPIQQDRGVKKIQYPDASEKMVARIQELYQLEQELYELRKTNFDTEKELYRKGFISEAPTPPVQLPEVHYYSSAPSLIPHDTLNALFSIAWVYQDSIMDTCSTMGIQKEVVIDTLRSYVTKYFVNERIVSKSTFDATEEGVKELFYTRSGYTTTKETYEAYWAPKGEGRKEVVTVTEEARQVQIENHQSRLKTNLKPEQYLITSLFCVVFDASSGRIITFGYYPSAIRKLN